MNIENKTTHVAFRASPSLATVINRCVEEGGWKNKSEMLRELFNKEISKIQKAEVAQLTEDAKR